MNKMIWGWTGEEATIDDLKKYIGDGWGQMVTKLVEDLFVAGWDGTIYQIKQKFGTLRFYAGKTTKQMDVLINRAELDSLKICETCGKEGKLLTGGYMVVLCDECHKGE